MLVEWVNGPIDGTMFEAPDGSEVIKAAFLMPYTIRQALENGWLPTTRDIIIPIEKRNDKYYVTYPTDEKIRQSYEGGEWT